MQFHGAQKWSCRLDPANTLLGFGMPRFDLRGCGCFGVIMEYLSKLFGFQLGGLTVPISLGGTQEAMEVFAGQRF